jgi:hypothetical protein
MIIMMRQLLVRRICLLAVVAIAVPVFIADSATGQRFPDIMQSVGEEERKKYNFEIPSLLEVSTTNFAALERFDVLVRMTSSFDTVGANNDKLFAGLTRDSKTFLRSTVDFQKKQGQWIESRVVDNVYFPPGKDDNPLNSVARFYRLVMVDHPANRILVHSPPEANYYSDTTAALRDTNEQFWGHLYVRDVRCIPLASKSELYTFVDVQTYHRNLATTREITRSETPSGVLRLEHSQTTEHGLSKSVYEFDRESNLLLSLQNQFFPKTAIFDKPIIFAALDKVEWEEIIGIFIPKKVRVLKRTSYRGGDEDQVGDEVTIYEFHWFCVNQDIPAGVFLTEKQLKDEAECRKLIDLELAGASNLQQPSKQLPQESVR